MAHRERHIRIRSVRRQPVDIKKLGRALIDLAQAQAEADAQAEHERRRRRRQDKDKRPRPPEAA